MNTERMSCGEAREKLPLYVGGDLDGAVMEAVRGHLDHCQECTARSASAAGARHELVAALRAREPDIARPDLWPAIRSALRAEGLVHPPATHRIPARSRVRPARWTWALVPAAAAAIVLALVQLGGGFSGSEADRLPEREVVDAPTMPVRVPMGEPLPRIETVGLQNVDAREPDSWLLAPYQRPVGQRSISSKTGISPAGFK